MIIDWSHIAAILLDGMTLESFIAYSLLMGAGALVYFGLDVARATRKRSDTPTRFSWRFMVMDNLVRLFAVTLLIMATVLWFDSFFGVPINAKLAFTQGLSIDAVIGVVLKSAKERGPLKANRDKLIKEYG